MYPFPPYSYLYVPHTHFSSHLHSHLYRRNVLMTNLTLSYKIQHFFIVNFPQSHLTNFVFCCLFLLFSLWLETGEKCRKFPKNFTFINERVRAFPLLEYVFHTCSMCVSGCVQAEAAVGLDTCHMYSGIKSPWGYLVQHCLLHHKKNWMKVKLALLWQLQET